MMSKGRSLYLRVPSTARIGWLATSRPARFLAAVRTVGWVGALAVAGAVLYANALTYHDISLAPAARYQQLATIGKRFAGTAPVGSGQPP